MPALSAAAGDKVRFVSTAGRAPGVGLEQALRAGLAPDGGLYHPERLEALSRDELDSMPGLSFRDTAWRVARHLFEDVVGLDSPALRAITGSAFDFEVPLVRLGPRRYCLELYRGPTLAFKDFGARFMARLLRHFDSRPSAASAGETTILVATSGDTGSAVAHAFLELEGYRVVVLFPRDAVSEAQRRLFTTLERNIRAVEIAGTFDDCQALAKRAFSDRELRRTTPLASANSINVGRLLPQMFYYFHARNQLPENERGSPLVFATPSGNFGNLTAGLMAKKLGLEVARFVAATNVNDVVPQYIESGDFRPRPSRATLSNAMDVGDPSNFARMQALYRKDPEDQASVLGAMRRDVQGASFTDHQTLEEIGRVHQEADYSLDPHAAVGSLGLSRGLASPELADDKSDCVGIFLATAHPAKFAEVVSRATGHAVTLPPALTECLDRAEKIERLPADYQALAELLRNS